MAEIGLPVSACCTGWLPENSRFAFQETHMKMYEGKNDSSRQASPGILSSGGTDNPRHLSSGGQRNSVPRKPEIKARIGWQLVGLRGNRLQRRLVGPYFAAFSTNGTTIGLQNRQNLSLPTHIFASILQVRKTAGSTDSRRIIRCAVMFQIC